MRWIKSLFYLISWFALSSGEAFGQEEKWTHYGVRPLAMGNAFVAVANDFNALFYNPAGLARLDDWYGEFLNPTFELSEETRSFINDGMNLSQKNSSTSAMLDLAEKHTGNVQHLSLGLTPHLVFPGVGFGMGLEFSGTMVFHRYPSIFVNAGPRVIMPLTFASNFLEDRLSLGFSVKARVRAGVDHEFSIEDIKAFQESEDGGNGPELSDYTTFGYGLGADFGLLFTPIKTMEPTLGISITDIAGTSFEKIPIKKGSENEAPDLVLPSVNVAVSAKPLQSGPMYLLAAVDMHSINQPYSFSKKFNLGLEWGYGSIIKIQTGLHQGYVTGGFQFDVRLLKLRFATYAEEMGATAGTVQDRRYALQLRLLF